MKLKKEKDWIEIDAEVDARNVSVETVLQDRGIVESNASHLTPLESVGMFVDPTNGVTYPMLADGINADLYDGMACHIEDLEEEWFDDLDESDSTIVKDIMDNLDLTSYGVALGYNDIEINGC